VAVAAGISFVTLGDGDVGVHSCGITTTAAAYCWGANSYGQLGDGVPTRDPVTPTKVLGDVLFTAIAVGALHTCGLAQGGVAYCWGAGSDGELGDGRFESSSVPVPVAGGLTFTDLTAGDFYSCGIATSGAAYCWGNGWDGKVGNGSVPHFNSDDDEIFFGEPSLVVGDHTFSSIDATFFHTCALTIQGAAYCWGWNAFGQLGDGSLGATGTPTAVVGPAA